VSLSGRFFLPGPVEVDSAVTEAMLRPIMPHRSARAEAMLKAMQPGLRALFGTQRPVMMHTCSATAMMEVGVRAGVRERVLCVVSGVFGERFARIAETCNKEVTRLCVPRGAVLEPAMLDTMLQGPPFDAVTLVHSETSTGALAPIEALLEHLRRLDDVILIVDGVTSIGATAVDFDRWGADFLFTGSQKALGVPPGLSLAVASERLLTRAGDLDDRGLYLDVVALHRAAEADRFATTPSLPIVYALEAQLARIAEEGLEARFARHRAMRERVDQWVTRHGGCEIWAPPGRRSDTVTALRLRPKRSALTIVDDLAQLGWTVATGMLDDADQVIRIGHMGDVTLDQLNGLLEVLEPRL
jgi:aspartate aminotransferase-like enzyme